MFFSKRALNIPSSFLPCSGDNAFLFFFAGLFIFCDPFDSLSIRVRRLVRRFDSELLGVLPDQPLKAAELPGLGANEAAHGIPAKKPIQNIESDVPSGSTHGDKAAADLGPQR